MSRFSFLKRKTFWKNALYAGALYLFLFLIVIIGLRIFTRHGKAYPVPDFTGLPWDRVLQVAEYNHFFVEVVDSNFIPYLQKGSVIDQNPQPGVLVKHRRTIFLTTNAFNQAKVEMPNLVGVSYRQGKTTLESRGLKVGKLIYRSDFAENNILKQLYEGEEVKKGTMIEKGQSIDLVLGNGLGRSTTPIPNLEQLSFLRAKNEINDAYLNLGTINYDGSVTTYIDSMNARVWKQRPTYSGGGRIVMGAKVDLWLSLDPERFPKTDDDSAEE